MQYNTRDVERGSGLWPPPPPPPTANGLAITISNEARSRGYSRRGFFLPFFFHYFQCKQCRPDWRTWDFDFPMTTRTFVKNIPQDTLVHLHWNTRVMSRRAPVQQMRVWKTTIPFSYFRTMILTALKIFFYVRRRTYLSTRSIEPRSIARHWRFCQENIHWNQHILCLSMNKFLRTTN